MKGAWTVKTETTQQERATREKRRTTRPRINKTRKKNESIRIPSVEVVA